MDSPLPFVEQYLTLVDRSVGVRGSECDASDAEGLASNGVPFDAGLAAVEELRSLVPDGATMAQFALRWILMHPAVTCAIPGAKDVRQVADNVRAAELAALSEETMTRVRAIYDRHVRAAVHDSW